MGLRDIFLLVLV